MISLFPKAKRKLTNSQSETTYNVRKLHELDKLAYEHGLEIIRLSV